LLSTVLYIIIGVWNYEFLLPSLAKTKEQDGIAFAYKALKERGKAYKSIRYHEEHKSYPTRNYALALLR
jgi:hypothetical protein